MKRVDITSLVDAPTQQTMRQSAPGERRNPTREDLRVRRQFAKQGSVDDDELDRVVRQAMSLRPTASAAPGVAPTKWREQLDRKEYAENYDPRNDSDGTPEPPKPPEEKTAASEYPHDKTWCSGCGKEDPSTAGRSGLTYCCNKPEAKTKPKEASLVSVDNLYGWGTGSDGGGVIALAAKAARMQTTAMPAPGDYGISVGDIYYADWGYDQTNIDFYKVVRLTPAGAEIQPIGMTIVEPGRGHDRVVPNPDVVREWDVLTGIGSNGSTKRTKVCRIRDWGGGRAVLVLNGDGEVAMKWGGEPITENGTNWGR